MIFETQKSNHYWWEGFIDSHRTDKLIEDNTAIVINNEFTCEIKI